MKKTKWFFNTKFSGRVIEEAHDKFLSINKISAKNSGFISLDIDFGDEEWSYDTREEFLSAYPKAKTFWFTHRVDDEELRVSRNEYSQSIVTAQSSKREKIESIFNIFEKNIATSKIIVTRKPVKIFIGHGKDEQWKILKDELHEKHGFEIEAYEIGPRAGLSVKEVLEGMMADSSVALLVMTGEDSHNDGELHARENVIHEIGLFQGKLGFKRAIILKEDKTSEFSNILGVNQIRFSKGNIKVCISDILSTIKREFK